MPPAGVITPFSNADSVMGPFALVTGPDNAIWFTQYISTEGGSYNDALGRLTDAEQHRDVHVAG